MAIIVLAGSNPAVAALRAEALRRAGIDCVPAADFDDLQRALLTIRPDAVLLDLPLTGLERHGLLDLPGAELPGLICGPPEAAAAVARPHRFLRASSSPEDWIAAVHQVLTTSLPFSFDADTGALAMGPAQAQLPPVEARLLAALIEARGAPVSAAVVVHRVWGYEFDTAAADLLRTHVYQLRRRLAEAGLPPLVETLPRRGYRLARLD